MKLQSEDVELRAHLGRLGLPHVAEYVRWCEAQGLRTTTRKSAREREREVRLFQEARWQGALDMARQLKRRPEAVLESALAGAFSCAQTSRADLWLISRSAHQLARASRPAALELLKIAQRRKFLLAERVVGRYDGGPGNTLIGGLFLLARLHPYWTRPLESWKPGSHNPERQFASLARHLLAEWDVPMCLDGAFFYPDPNRREAGRALGWWRHVARGQSLFTAHDLPLALTRKMAHLVHTEAPASLMPEEALRWGQARGLGMSERQTRALLATPLGLRFDDESFWEGFVRLVADNPLLDPAQVGPLQDYLHWERRTPRGPGERDRLPVDFTLKGRTVGALLERMESWHARTVRESRHSVVSWDATERAGLLVTEGAWQWQLRELTSAKELSVEGRAMRHCVGTYASTCARGDISIWSLQVLGPLTTGWLRAMTIAVSRHGQITEARGWCNALPSADGKGSYARLAPDERSVLLRARRIVQRWAVQENLVLPAYLSGS